MKSTLIAGIALVVMPVLMSASCKKTTTKDNGNSTKCGPDVMCTMQFAMVSIKVTNAKGEAVKLDNYYTIRPATGEMITASESMEGYYTVLDDSYQKKLQQSSDKFQFIGLKGGKQIVNETYTISADCCHIQKQSGKIEVIIP